MLREETEENILFEIQITKSRLQQIEKHAMFKIVAALLAVGMLISALGAFFNKHVSNFNIACFVIAAPVLILFFRHMTEETRLRNYLKELEFKLSRIK